MWRWPSSSRRRWVWFRAGIRRRGRRSSTPSRRCGRSEAMAISISLAQNLGVAMDAVWAHRFRSLLTILGIVIGITTVVTVSSLLTGLREGIVIFFQEMGPDNI